MISVNEAINRIRSNTALLLPVVKPVKDALGRVLAKDVYAPLNLPPFNQSGMDGYAFRYNDFLQAKEFTVGGEIAAGDNNHHPFAPQQAVRIFTGAPLPLWADTVVMQEKTQRINDRIIILDEQLSKGSNVRTAGSEITKGDMALPTSTVLTPAAIGFLAGLGITDVSVYPQPAIHIIVTGNELQEPGLPLQRGQVYESNSVMLQSALQQLNITNLRITKVNDDENKLCEAIAAALATFDLILLTGGVSVGDYDFVVQAASACGAEQLFHKVAQRPGKPLYVGIKENKMVFGLPGNPASVLSCFYNYVVVAIECMTGRKPLLQRKFLPLAASFNKTIGFTQFLKATCNENEVEPLNAQESFRLSSFAVANSLIVLPEGIREFAQGETVEVLCLPYL